MLNSTASLVWELADGSRTIHEISRELATEFEVPFETALEDAAEMISQFQEKGLLEA
jgi:hypothetical protein